MSPDLSENLEADEDLDNDDGEGESDEDGNDDDLEEADSLIPLDLTTRPSSHSHSYTARTIAHKHSRSPPPPPPYGRDTSSPRSERVARAKHIASSLHVELDPSASGSESGSESELVETNARQRIRAMKRSVRLKEKELYLVAQAASAILRQHQQLLDYLPADVKATVPSLSESTSTRRSSTPSRTLVYSGNGDLASSLALSTSSSAPQVASRQLHRHSGRRESSSTPSLRSSGRSNRTSAVQLEMSAARITELEHLLYAAKDEEKRHLSVLKRLQRENQNLRTDRERLEGDLSSAMERRQPTPLRDDGLSRQLRQSGSTKKNSPPSLKRPALRSFRLRSSQQFSTTPFAPPTERRWSAKVEDGTKRYSVPLSAVSTEIEEIQASSAAATETEYESALDQETDGPTAQEDEEELTAVFHQLSTTPQSSPPGTAAYWDGRRSLSSELAAAGEPTCEPDKRRETALMATYNKLEARSSARTINPPRRGRLSRDLFDPPGGGTPPRSSLYGQTMRDSRTVPVSLDSHDTGTRQEFRLRTQPTGILKRTGASISPSRRESRKWSYRPRRLVVVPMKDRPDSVRIASRRRARSPSVSADRTPLVVAHRQGYEPRTIPGKAVSDVLRCLAFLLEWFEVPARQ